MFSISAAILGSVAYNTNKATGTFKPFKPTPKICTKCGRDKNESYHDGFNGWYIDDNLQCK